MTVKPDRLPPHMTWGIVKSDPFTVEIKCEICRGVTIREHSVGDALDRAELHYDRQHLIPALRAAVTEADAATMAGQFAALRVELASLWSVIRAEAIDSWLRVREMFRRQ